MSDAIIAETVHIGAERIQAYLARPLGPGTYPGVVVIHHLPGYDEATKEMVRRFAVHGYSALCPNLYWREAPNAAPDDAAAFVRAQGGIPDEQIIRDVTTAAEALRALDTASGRVGVIGHCSGGRQALLASTAAPVDAAVDCYGAFALEPPPSTSTLRARPIRDRLPDVRCPVLGLFGDDDQFPSPAEVAELAAELDKHGKSFEYHSYEGAGHAFFSVDRPSYRPAAAVDGWHRVFSFFGRHLEA
ncbi:dienelactone hydrolase family protein [Dactylosporangium sp. AC04546]|uniref:dienelactone hydrolase family protein n=1 Tax=Dactylosporangium sp. AC04546 TaxID=2862460 RepID=UPI001EE102E9|nr:dienelactone hydrolase family protein [Dactylosporangium sp. AC04546]WVK81914.1 dienelactone hydrolase family protein [Dactylosporangium sp. AC04546]